MMRIDGMDSIGALPLPRPNPGVGKTTGFEDLLRDSLREANRFQSNAEKQITELATGKSTDPDIAVNAITQADLAFRTMIQIRNKLVQAWDELRQMQI